MKHARFIFALLPLAIVSAGGCATVSLSLAPDDSIDEARSFYVVAQEADRRDVHLAIRDAFQQLGRHVAAGAEVAMPADADVRVVYRAEWAYDMTPYLLNLQIRFVDPATGGVISEGRSYRPSLQRKRPIFMATEVLSQMLASPVAVE